MFNYKGKGFWGGEKGHVHGLQEFGFYALACLLAYLLSPVFGLIIGLMISLKADKYWINREIEQSQVMVATGRRASALASDLDGNVPSKPTGFWTQDAIDDVKFPRKLRPYIGFATGLVLVYIYTQTGFTGLLIDLAIARWF